MMTLRFEDAVRLGIIALYLSMIYESNGSSLVHLSFSLTTVTYRTSKVFVEIDGMKAFTFKELAYTKY